MTLLVLLALLLSLVIGFVVLVHPRSLQRRHRRLQEQADQLSLRLENNFNKITEDHGELMTLKHQVLDFKHQTETLRVKVDALEQERKRFHDYFLLRREAVLEGANCSCSPRGKPHSVHCKGWNGGPSHEDT